MSKVDGWHISPPLTWLPDSATITSLVECHLIFYHLPNITHGWWCGQIPHLLQAVDNRYGFYVSFVQTVSKLSDIPLGNPEQVGHPLLSATKEIILS